MEKESEHENNDTEKETLKEDISPINGNDNEKEDLSVEIGASDHKKEYSTNKKAAEVNGENGLFPGSRSISTRRHLDVYENEVNETLERDQISSEIHSHDGDGAAQKLEDEAAAADKENIWSEESKQILHEMSKEQDKATQLNRQLQKKLAKYFSKRSRDYHQLEREKPVTEQLQKYERYINIFTDLKQQLAADSDTAQQQAEELRLQVQEMLVQVENEWRVFVTMKQDRAVAALSPYLGKGAAQARVESVLKAEQLRQDELTSVRLKHFRLKLKNHRLQADLCERAELAQDSYQVQYERLMKEMLVQKKQAEKQSEESLKLEKMISSCSELLSNVKEKLYWSQMEVQAKQEQLAKVEALMAKKRDILIRTRQARNSLQRDNQRLKERCGALGNGALLCDFEDTVDALDHLEKHLENLKCQQAKMGEIKNGRQLK